MRVAAHPATRRNNNAQNANSRARRSPLAGPYHLAVCSVPSRAVTWSGAHAPQILQSVIHQRGARNVTTITLKAVQTTLAVCRFVR